MQYPSNTQPTAAVLRSFDQSSAAAQAELYTENEDLRRSRLHWRGAWASTVIGLVIAALGCVQLANALVEANKERDAAYLDLENRPVVYTRHYDADGGAVFDRWTTEPSISSATCGCRP